MVWLAGGDPRPTFPDNTFIYFAATTSLVPKELESLFMQACRRHILFASFLEKKGEGLLSVRARGGGEKWHVWLHV